MGEHYEELEKDYFKTFRQELETARCLWHDIHKYALAMKAMVPEDMDCRELDDLLKLVSREGTLVDVENHTLNVILSYYVGKAAEMAIPVTLDVAVAPELPISAVDLSVILGNTLDNALEACAELPEEQRKIVLTLKLKNNTLLYSIQNAWVKNQTKEKGELHGYGLKSIQKTIKKYRGNMVITRNDASFTVTILLSLPTE